MTSQPPCSCSPRASASGRASPRIPRSGRAIATPRHEHKPRLWNGYAWSRLICSFFMFRTVVSESPRRPLVCAGLGYWQVFLI